MNEHHVEVHLAVAAVDRHRPEKSRFAVVTDPFSLPHKPLIRGASASQVASDLIHELLGIAGPSMSFLHLDGPQVFEQMYQDRLVLLYSLVIPEKVPLYLPSSSWVDMDSVISDTRVLTMFATACKFFVNRHRDSHELLEA